MGRQCRGYPLTLWSGGGGLGVGGLATFVYVSDDSSMDRGFVVVPVTDEAELYDVEKLRERLERVPDMLKRWGRVANAGAQFRSEMAMDDAATGWLRLSSSVHMAMQHSADTLQALHRLIPPNGETPIPFVSHYAVARSGIEASALALWLLGPDDPKVRIARHLRNIMREVEEETSFGRRAVEASRHYPEIGTNAAIDKERKRMKAWRKKRLEEVQRIASAAGIEVPPGDWQVGFAEIVRDATEGTNLPGIFGEIVWRELSGLTHPSLSRAVRAHRSEIVSDDAAMYNAMWSSSTNLVRIAVEASMSQFIQAVDLFAGRKLRPGNPASYLP